MCQAAYHKEAREPIGFDYDYSNGFNNVLMHSVAKLLDYIGFWIRIL